MARGGDERSGEPELGGWAAAEALRACLSASRPLGRGETEDLLLAVRAVVVGGRAACRHYGGPLRVTDKGKDDPVTAADHASDRAIREVLARDRPGDPILSEESPPPDGVRSPGRLWIVDPLDGTKEFIAGNGEFSVMVGLAQDGGATLGAVYQPAAQLIFAGLTARGAWRLEGAAGGWRVSPLRVDRYAAVRGPPRLVRSRSHADARLARLVESLGEVEEVVSGSVGIKCALVAAGAADLYVHPVPYLKEWDTCAPEAVLRGAGGVVSDCSGAALRYGKPDPRQPAGIFAARPGLWDRVGPVVCQVVRRSLEDEPHSEGRT